MFEALVAAVPQSLPQVEKSAALLRGLSELVYYHYANCPPYARIIDIVWGGLKSYSGIADIPYLPVGIFKQLELATTKTPSFTMRSSGTSGQPPSRIIVDDETACRQSAALVATFRPLLGERRRPFLVIDTKEVVATTELTARGAGVLGMMKFGGRATFALNPALEINKDAINTFIAENGEDEFLIFGFTYLIWSKLYKSYGDGELDLSNAVLVHSGGWKKLESERISNSEFLAALKRLFNMTNIYNFYGFVEQIGSVFVEGADGLLYPPNFSDGIIRRPDGVASASIGKEGVIR